jgi:hypothetical protein
MRSVRALAVLSLSLALVLGIVPTAAAGPPGSWTKVSTGNVISINEPGLFRTGDGALHIAFTRRNTNNTDSIGHTAVAPTGKTTRQNIAVGNWQTIIDDPKLVAAAGGSMRLVFAGLRTLDPNNYFTKGVMYSSIGNEAGSTWTLQNTSMSQDNFAYASYGTGATTLSDLTPIASWTLNTNVRWHEGTSNTAPASTPDSTFTQACCVYHSMLVRDGGKVWLAWYGNGSSNASNGTFVKQIEPSVGATMKVPSSSVAGPLSLAPDQAVAMAARKGGGTFVAFCVGYPTCNYMGLWKVGTDNVRKIPKTAGADTVAISSGPAGRLWIAWENNSANKVFVTRTNTNGTKFGSIRAMNGPKGAASIYRLAIEGSRGKGDIVINTGAGLFHQQVLPGLSLSASPNKWNGGSSKTVTFLVTDATEPVKGAPVKVGTRSCKTGTNGKCTISFPKMAAQKLKATASKAGYGKVTVTLTVT